MWCVFDGDGHLVQRFRSEVAARRWAAHYPGFFVEYREWRHPAPGYGDRRNKKCRV